MSFEFSIQGYFRNDNYRIRLVGNILKVEQIIFGKSAETGKEVSVTDNEGWINLMQFLHTCHWAKNYESDILDGTQWELKVKSYGINLKSYGSNNYPENFQEFLSRLNSILQPINVKVE